MILARVPEICEGPLKFKLEVEPANPNEKSRIGVARIIAGASIIITIVHRWNIRFIGNPLFLRIESMCS
jgi:hypothetical protein